MSWLRWAGDLLWGYFQSVLEDHAYALVAVVFAVVRAAGTTVRTGETGLRFSFGRATRVVEPGFHPLLPFLQVIRTLPTRSRTIDIPRQRVTTLDGLVYDVDANLMFRVVDVRRALIEIDELDKGMFQVLGLGVQEVLRARERGSMHVSGELDLALGRRMAARLEAWGVEVERAGFTSIEPSPRTLRVTQLAANAEERARNLALLEAGGIPRSRALPLLGVASFPTTRTRKLRRFARARGRTRRLLRRVDEALAREELSTAAVPRRWRGLYEERAYQGQDVDPRENVLLRLQPRRADRAARAKSGGKARA